MTEPEEKHLFDNPQNVKRLIYALYAACGLSVLAEFFIHLHPKHPLESIFNFYSLYGFVMCVALVLGAKVLRVIIMRKEDYYDE
jgi:hypothetical protein